MPKKIIVDIDLNEIKNLDKGRFFVQADIELVKKCLSQRQSCDFKMKLGLNPIMEE